MKNNKIIIDQERCVGCGSCANACHQSAISIVNGKAKVVNEEACDHIGNCLPVCPVGAISFEGQPQGGCSGSAVKKIIQSDVTPSTLECLPSQLAQWPVQIKLVPVVAPYFDKASLLIAADCTAFAYAGFHGKFMTGKVTIIGCPKLDEGDYSDKIAQILTQNDVRSITVVRMEVPCCAGIDHAVRQGLGQSKKEIPCQTIILSLEGEILSQQL
ncbi:MAG: 4Fe-4S binding protein [Eubacteriales bacterium]